MTFHLFLYASFSFKQKEFLNLTQYLLTYYIVLATIYLPFNILIVDILRISKFIECLQAFFL